MKTWWSLAVIVLAVACSKEEKKTPVAGGGQPQKKENAAQPSKGDDPAPQKKAEDKKAKVEALRAQRDELDARIKELSGKLKGLDRKHDAEREGLPDVGKLRRRLVQLIRDSNNATSTYNTLKRKYDELKKYADTAITGELKALRDQMKEVEKRYEVAQSGWRRALHEDAMGVVGDSPVKRELDLCRVMKTKWFEVTPDARRGTAAGAKKQEISEAFRSWLKAEAPRKELCGKILAQDLAPKGKTPDTYDFSDLEFFILLELMEDSLDRQNIAVEKKELVETEAKLDVIQKELDELREKIASKMQQGGGKLEEYEDVSGRIEDAKDKARDLATQVQEERRTFAEIEDLNRRQEKEGEDLANALEDAKRELAKVKRSLRSLGG